MGGIEKLVPKRRFKEFINSGDWEWRKIKDLYAFLQNNSLSRAELNDEKGQALNVHYGDILVKYGEVLEVKRNELPYITDNTIVSKFQSSILENGDVIITDAAEDNTVGKTTEIAGLSGEIVLSGLHTIPCRPKQKFAKGYLGYYMNSNPYHDQLLSLIQGTKISSISKTAIQNTDIKYPKSEDEQKSIGEYFQNLDALITLHQRKVEKIKALKSAYLSEMFPAEGECKPKRRFVGYTEEWKQYKLGEVGELTSSKRVHAKDYVENGIPFYRGKEISELRENKPVTEMLYITEEKYNMMSKLYGNPVKGDLLITAVGTIGNTWVVDKLPFYFKDGNLIWFKNIKCNSKYLDYLLSTPEGQNKIYASAIGSNQKALTIVNLNELSFMFPKAAEQQQIAAYFSILDNLFTLNQRKLEKLQNIKKAFLNEMFI